MSTIQMIYDHSPIFGQNVMVSTSGYLRNRQRYGKTYWEHRAWLEDFDTWDLHEKLQYQDKQTHLFVEYAATNSKFYRSLYDGIEVSEIRQVSDLSSLPIVGKEALRANIEDVFTIPKRGAVIGHTGGTTGKSLTIRATPQDSMLRMAMLDHFKSRVGFEHRRMRRATFSGKHIVPPSSQQSIYWRYNAACKQMLYSTFHISEATLGQYVRSLNRFKPQAIDGFFTSIVDVANYIDRNQIQLTFSPIAIFPTSETINPEGRAVLERIFDSPVYDQYASSEGAPFITQCAHRTLHVETSTGVFERHPNHPDEVVVTSFTSSGTPLIRYAIGDSMSLGPTVECPCGIASPTVHTIKGRADDFLYRADGAKVNAGNIANLFKNIPNALIRAQLVQTEIGKVLALLEVDERLYREHYDAILRDEFRHKFDRHTKLEIRHVKDIPRQISGKYRFIVNTTDSIRT